MSKDVDHYFNCDSITGVISLKKTFVKSQTKPKYLLRVRAADNGTNVLSSETIVEISVINKDQPMFSKHYDVQVYEDEQKGHRLLAVNAKGRDDRQVYYQISSGDYYEVFKLGFTTGNETLDIVWKLHI